MRYERHGGGTPELKAPTEVEKVVIVDELSKFFRESLEISQAGAIGVSDSGHGVFFAVDDRGTSYAIKRFGNFEKAQKEIDNLQEAAKRGIKTLELSINQPFDVPRIAGASVVTKRIPSLSTMTSVSWSEYYAGQSSYETYIVPIIESIGKYIGDIHKVGLCHGDMQLKNIATVPHGEFVTFDLENAFYSDEKDPLQQWEFQNYCMKDITTVIESLARSGFMASSTIDVFWQEIQDHLLQSYMSAIDNDFILGDERFPEIERCLEQCQNIIAKQAEPKDVSKLIVHAA